MKFNRGHLLTLIVVFATLLLLRNVFTSDPAAPKSENKRIEDINSALPIPEAWDGDFDAMIKRRLVRILVPYSKTLYFLDQGRARGVVHDAGKELEKRLNRSYGSKTLPIRVVFIPTAREHLLQDLIDGYGDIAAGNLTVTPGRKKLVDFTETGFRDVSEIVVTGPGTPEIETLTDLAGIPIYVRRSSSYHEHLIKLKDELQIALNIQPADEVLEDEDILEMVNAGMLPLTIVDDHKATFWAQLLEDIELREDLIINRGGKIGWAIRKNSPKLANELNEFAQSEGRRKGLANMLLKRYLGSTKYVLKSTDSEELEKFDKMVELFKAAAEAYGLDYQLLMAQGYQESRLDQTVRSSAGAVGIMQILPSTAASKAVGIDNIAEDAEKNVHAGAKYMRHLLDTYLNDPEIDETNKLLLCLAAYNAGPRNLRKMRKRAVEMGLDPKVWFNNVEHASAALIGRETTQYVSNIYKYYLAYILIEERRNIRAERVSSVGF
jgi:membrane-bound lytic murein transglycosylase MltF